METQTKQNKLIDKVIKKLHSTALGELQIDAILHRYLDDETEEELKNRLKD